MYGNRVESLVKKHTLQHVGPCLRFVQLLVQLVNICMLKDLT